jgi:nucleotide-binding universal stress UspA family protein
MATLTSILLHLDASPRSAVRLALAQRLAQAHGARVTALFAVNSAFVELPFAMAENSQAGELMARFDSERRERALAQFDRALAGSSDGGTAFRWAETRTEPVVWAVTQRAWCHDLLLLGQHEPGSPQARDLPADFVESVIVDSGRPALVVPYTGRFDTLGERVLVAWNASRESARALSAALPLLAKAREVHVACWTEVQGAAQAAADRALFEQYLAAHGLAATLHWYGDGPGQPGDRLLSLAADLDSDLVVMGCYGHSRTREFVLGGATRTVLRSMTVPVLMVH